MKEMKEMMKHDMFDICKTTHPDGRAVKRQLTWTWSCSSGGVWRISHPASSTWTVTHTAMCGALTCQATFLGPIGQYNLAKGLHRSGVICEGDGAPNVKSIEAGLPNALNAYEAIGYRGIGKDELMELKLTSLAERNLETEGAGTG